MRMLTPALGLNPGYLLLVLVNQPWAPWNSSARSLNAVSRVVSKSLLTAFSCNNATLGLAQEGRGRATHCRFFCSPLLALWDGGAALNSAGLAENERVVLEVAAGLRSVQQQVNTGPDGGIFRAMTDKTALFPKGLQSQHGNTRSSVTCLCVCEI